MKKHKEKGICYAYYAEGLPMQAVRKARKSKVEEQLNLENWCFQANSISNLIIFSHSGHGLMGCQWVMIWVKLRIWFLFMSLIWN